MWDATPFLFNWLKEGFEKIHEEWFCWDGRRGGCIIKYLPFPDTDITADSIVLLPDIRKLSESFQKTDT